MGTMTTSITGNLEPLVPMFLFLGKVHFLELAPAVSRKGKVDAITTTQIPDLVCSLSLAVQGTRSAEPASSQIRN
jgi:hypothetical protein